jgi:PadR family transcriptional regulator PadR
MPDSKSDRLRGTLELLILRTLAWGPRHGYAIARWLGETTNDKLRIEEGSMYPALYRMEKRGLLASDWQTSELGRPAKFYSLTPAGKQHLEREMAEWSDFTMAVGMVLRPVS